MGLVDNTGLYNSDSVNTIATGAFAPGVTVSDVYLMLAANDGVKWRGLSSIPSTSEGLRIVKSPVASIITPYNSGFTGWSPLLQWMFNF